MNRPQGTRLAMHEARMARHHVLVTGTGRAGTTFLMQLLTQLGQDTGFANADERVNEISHAGMERNILDEDAPYIVKSPHVSGRLTEILASGEVVIDHVIVPMRELFAAAESRRFVEAHPKRESLGDVAPGGMWGTAAAAQQESVLAEMTHQLMHALAVHDIPHTLLAFPRLATDESYLFQKLRPLLPGIEKDAFFSAFQAVSRPDLIHEFAEDEPERQARLSVLDASQARREEATLRRLQDLLRRNTALNRERLRLVRQADEAQARAGMAERALKQLRTRHGVRIRGDNPERTGDDPRGDR